VGGTSSFNFKFKLFQSVFKIKFLKNMFLFFFLYVVVIFVIFNVFFMLIIFYVICLLYAKFFFVHFFPFKKKTLNINYNLCSLEI
jgi:hypothetical protein